MISRSVRLGRSVTSWQLALAQQRRCSVANACAGRRAAALTIRSYSSDGMRFSKEQMEELIRDPTKRIPKEPKTGGNKSGRSSWRDRRNAAANKDRGDYVGDAFDGPIRGADGSIATIANDLEAVADALPTTEVDEAKGAPERLEPTQTKDETVRTVANERTEMPDIESYEPTEAELAEMLKEAEAASTNVSSGADEAIQEQPQTEEDAGTPEFGTALHETYDSLASEDDIVFETPPTELQSRRPFNDELLTHQYLGVAALGQPVEALILKDPNRMKRARRSLPVLETEPTFSKAVELKWTDYVESTDDSKDPAREAWDNIDEMRPTDTNIISIYDFDHLVSSLVDGFTKQQLATYITTKHAEDLGAAVEEPQLPWVVKQTPWKAEHDIELQDTKPKYLLSAAIVDKVWKLDVREQVDSLGRALLWLEPITFKLLTGHGRHLLESIQRDILNAGNNERLAAKSEESRIGIYASKATIAPVIARLNEAAEAVTSAQISTEYIAAENLEQSVLDHLARVTNTIIEKGKGKTLTIHWIADGDRPRPPSTDTDTATVPEGPADIVWRLLVAADSAPEPRTKTVPSIVINGMKRWSTDVSNVEHYREKRSMSWRDKLRSWTRQTAPAATPTDKKQPPSRLVSKAKLGHLLSNSEGSDVSEVLSVAFGHILHADEAKGGKAAATTERRAILSPVIPHPAALTNVSASDAPVAQHTSIVLNFSPDTTQKDGRGGSGKRLPCVRLTLPVDESTDLSNFDFPPNSTLQALTGQRVQDVLLPQESVDVRILQQQLQTLDAEQPSLKQFLSASEFNLLEGRLRTPSRIRLSLPGAEDELPYLFMGLEVRQAVETTLRDGHVFRYESIEAGQHGGQRQELSLRCAAAVAKAVDGEDGGFMKLAEDIAAGRLFSWNDGHSLMQERSNEEFTMDMLEEPEEGEVEGEGALEGDQSLLVKDELLETEQVRRPEESASETVVEDDAPETARDLLVENDAASLSAEGSTAPESASATEDAGTAAAAATRETVNPEAAPSVEAQTPTAGSAAEETPADGEQAPTDGDETVTVGEKAAADAGHTPAEQPAAKPDAMSSADKSTTTSDDDGSAAPPSEHKP